MPDRHEIENWLVRECNSLLGYAESVGRARGCFDRNSAEDVLQEALQSFLSQWQTVVPECWRSYLCKAIRNKWSDHHRKKLTTRCVSVAAEILDQEYPDLKASCKNEYLEAFHDYLPRCLERLTELDKTMIQLKYVEGLAQIEIAGIIGKSAARVSQRLPELVCKLRNCLNSYWTRV